MTERKTILIVDDQESIIKSLKRLLLTEPYNILSAPNGQAALELISNRKEDDEFFLIISDQRMPNMTGIEFLEKTVTILPDAIRFILSGYSDTHNAADAMKKGTIHRYLTKPWKNNELLMMIRQACESPKNVRRLANSYDSGSSESQEPNVMEKEIREFDQRSKDSSLGRMAVHHGFINQEQLDISMVAMQIERQKGREVSLENILFEKGLISSDNMGKLVAATRRKLGKSFGAIAIKDYGVLPEEVDRCFAIQAKEFSNTTTCRLLGNILVAEKILTEDQRDSIVIDMTYSEREELPSADNGIPSLQNTNTNKTSPLQNVNTSNTSPLQNANTSTTSPLQSGNIDEGSMLQSENKDTLNDKIILNKRKKKFFKQRALDKIFCKSAIKKNFATESEILKALEEQLIHFTKTFEIRLIKDILVECSIMSKTQAESIASGISGDTNHPSPLHIEKSNNTIPLQKTEAQQNSANQKNIINQKKTITIGQNSAFEVTLSDDGIEATIKITDDVPEGMTVDNLKKLLAEQNITYGLAEDVAIQLFLRSGLSNSATEKEKAAEREEFTIAKGKPLKEGRNAVVKYFFKDNKADFGKELDSGKFDYRERAEMANINQGTILAEKIPLIPAVNGMNVRGNEIVAPTPADVNLDCGKGAEISKDGLKVIATSNGRPDISLTGKISVLPEIIIKGDVDFKTGNIKFSGDVNVQGSILAGFSVTANNLKVSDIEEADVTTVNTLLVKNSINNANIKAGGTIAAQIIKNSIVFSQGDVIVQKEIVDSTIITSGRVIVPRGRIVATTIHAAKGVQAMNIGSEVSSPCHIFPGADDHAMDIIKVFDEKFDSQKEILVKLESFKVQYEQQNWKQLTRLSEISKVQEQLAIERKNILKQIKIASSDTTTNDTVRKKINDSLSDVDRKILKLDETINSLFDEHDNTQNKVNEIKIKIKDVENQMQILLKEKKVFETWYESQKEEARKQGVGVYVQGTIFARNQITGSEGSITLKSNVRNSKIHQIVNSEDPTNPFHEMRIDSLVSKGSQPHVYRT